MDRPRYQSTPDERHRASENDVPEYAKSTWDEDVFIATLRFFAGAVFLGWPIWFLLRFWMSPIVALIGFVMAGALGVWKGDRLFNRLIDSRVWRAMTWFRYW